jgi:hypothetical protein
MSTGASKPPFEISHLRESVELEVFCAEECIDPLVWIASASVAAW